MGRLFSRRLVIVAGKGGVGKSTVCAALGLAAARTGRRTCIVELNTLQRATAVFGLPDGGYDVVRLDPNLPLYATNLTPQEALREIGLMKLRFRTVFNLVFENDLMKRLMRMVPGMNETLLLGKAVHMVEKARDPDGRPTWDTVILDAPATGHGISLLRLPQVILNAVSTGPMAYEATIMKDLLEDPTRTSFNVVTLPAEMPANEALELAEQAREVLRVPTGFLFVNAVLPPGVDGARADLVARASARPGALPPKVAAALASVDLYERRRTIEAGHIQRLERASQMPVVCLPHLFAEAVGRPTLETLADAAVAGMEAAMARAKGKGP